MHTQTTLTLQAYVLYPMLTLFHLSVVVALVSILSIVITERKALDSDATHLEPTHLLASDRLKTTVVILNWSRFSNVNRITSTICEHLLEDTVHSIIVWNNNPKSISFSDFLNTKCPEERLHIINSPENLYFQARYIACGQAKTPYCFIQDDDYLVLPEIIRALSLRINEASTSIHLQPADEMLSSQLRTTIVWPKVHATFAWLGYGTIITRRSAIKFLSLLDKLQLSVEERQMADNYFTILSNQIPERWFDPGIGLGGGQPFTIGPDGEERNNRHILRAAELLHSIANSGDSYVDLPYVGSSSLPFDNAISRAPCQGRLCVFETSIELLPDLGLDTSVSAATEILELEKNRSQKLGNARKAHYLGFPPSNAVDGRYETALRSTENAKKDDWIVLDLTQGVFAEQLALILEVGQATETILRSAIFELSQDRITWETWSSHLNCTKRLEGESSVTTCRTEFTRVYVRYFRVRLSKDIGEKWAINEMYVDISKSP